MRKEKALLFCVIALAALNIACLAFIILGRPRPPQERLDGLIINSLHLNTAQVEKFNQLKQEHHDKMREIDKQIKQPFFQYFTLLEGAKNQQKEDSLKNVLADLYKQKVQATYQHFDEIKAMCSPEQQKGFKKIIPSLMNVISPKKNDGPGRGK